MEVEPEHVGGEPLDPLQRQPAATGLVAHADDTMAGLAPLRLRLRRRHGGRREHRQVL